MSKPCTSFAAFVFQGDGNCVVGVLDFEEARVIHSLSSRVGFFASTNLMRLDESATATAQPGDWIDGANQFGQFIKAKNVVEVLYPSDGFDILALWGQRQIAGVGNLLSDGRDVYGNAAATFDATHEIMPG